METRERLLTRHEAAEELGISVPMTDKLIASGELIATRIGRRVLIQRRHIRELLETNVSVPSRQEAPMYEPPSFEERQTIGLEVAAMIDAARERDYAKLTQLTHGSNTPVWKHAVEGFIQAAWLAEHISEFDSPDRAMAALRRQITTEAD